MSAYIDQFATARTLTDAEVASLMKATGEHVGGFRDHVLFALALETGLREHELLALNWADVCGAGGEPRRIVRLTIFKGAGRAKAADLKAQEVRLSEKTGAKLARLRAVSARDGLPAGDGDAVFATVRGRMAERTARHVFKVWQKRAGFDREFTFHELRHTAITRIYRASGGDIRLAQRAARHKRVTTTERYTHASDEALSRVANLAAVG